MVDVGGRMVDFIFLTVFVDETRVSCLLNLGNHRCQCKGHDYCRELRLLYFVMCFMGSALIFASNGAYLPPPHQPAIWLACASCYYKSAFSVGNMTVLASCDSQ